MKYNLHTIKSTNAVFSLRSLDRCIQLCNHHHNHCIEHFLHPQKSFCTALPSVSSPRPSSLIITDPLSDIIAFHGFFFFFFER